MVDAGVGVGVAAAEAVVSKMVEAAASCGLLAEEHIVAAGTGAGIEAEVACESNQCSVVEASAGSWWSVAGSLVPSPPYWDGGEELAKSCWRWKGNEDVQP